MSKIKNLWLRGSKQRLGGAVTYMLKGQQIVRELAAHVSNPQTDAQMEQRVKLPNLVGFYRANKAWMDKYSFESKKKTWSDYNAFVSANLKNNQIYLTKEQVQAGAAVAYPYIITKGTLPSVSVQEDNGNEQFHTDLYTGELVITAGDTSTTVAMLAAALIENNNGLHEGDQLSFVWNLQQVDADGTPFIICRYVELMLDLADSMTIADRIGQDVLITDEYAGMTCVCFKYQSDVQVQGGACIISRSVSGTIKVSSQSLVVNSPEVAIEFAGDTAMRKAIRSYAPSATEPFLLPGYQGGTIDAFVAPRILSVGDGTDTWTGGDSIAANKDVSIISLSSWPASMQVSGVGVNFYTSQDDSTNGEVQGYNTNPLDGTIEILGIDKPNGAQFYSEIHITTSLGLIVIPFSWGGEVTNGGDVTE